LRDRGVDPLTGEGVPVPSRRQLHRRVGEALVEDGVLQAGTGGVGVYCGGPGGALFLRQRGQAARGLLGRVHHRLAGGVLGLRLRAAEHVEEVMEIEPELIRLEAEDGRAWRRRRARWRCVTGGAGAVAAAARAPCSMSKKNVALPLGPILRVYGRLLGPASRVSYAPFGRSMMVKARAAGLCCAGLLAFAGVAAEEPELGWSDQAELSYVLTAGNSESTTLGFKNELKRTWEKSLFSFKAAAIRAESTTFVRTAIGTPDNFVFIEDKESSLTAENYLAALRYDRKVSDFLFWYGGALWERNRFAGVENREIVEGGLGNVWVDREDVKFKTTYALTYTDQEDVVEVPDQDGTFAGVRLGWDYWHKFGGEHRVREHPGAGRQPGRHLRLARRHVERRDRDHDQAPGLEGRPEVALRRPALLPGRALAGRPGRSHGRAGAGRAGEPRHHLHHLAGGELVAISGGTMATGFPVEHCTRSSSPAPTP
jgi:hypothetical protein